MVGLLPSPHVGEKNLKHAEMQNIVLPGNNLIFINTNLHFYYRMLGSKCNISRLANITLLFFVSLLVQ